jgi:hypothetical protein
VAVLGIGGYGLWEGFFETQRSDDFRQVYVGMKAQSLSSAFPYRVHARRDLSSRLGLRAALRRFGALDGIAYLAGSRNEDGEVVGLEFEGGRLARHNASGGWARVLRPGMSAQRVARDLPPNLDFRVLPKGQAAEFEVDLAKEASRIKGFDGTLSASDFNAVFAFRFQLGLKDGRIVRKSFRRYRD